MGEPVSTQLLGAVGHAAGLYYRRVLLDHIEVIFAPEQQLDPLEALRQLSRNRTIVAAWARHEGHDRDGVAQ